MADSDLAARVTEYKQLQHLLSVMKADPLMVFFTSQGILFTRDNSPQGWLFTKEDEGWTLKLVPVPG